MNDNFYTDITAGIEISHHGKPDVYWELEEFHLDSSYKIFLIISGNAECHVEENIYSLKSGDLLILANYEKHKFIFDYGKIPEAVEISFDPRHFLINCSDHLQSMLACFTNRQKGCRNKISLKKHQFKKIRDLVLKMEYASGNSFYGDSILIICAFFEALVYINSMYINYSFNSDKTEDKNNKLAGIIKYIDENIGNELSLQLLEKRFYISKHHLCRSFKKATGTTPHSYIIEKRIMLAKKLLCNGYEVNEVCVRSGFNDYSHFQKVFKKYTKTTPYKYSRSTHKGNVIDGISENQNLSISVADDLPDLIVTGLSWFPENPEAGERVMFSATVENIGSAPTPAGTIIGMGFMIDGLCLVWSDSHSTSLLPGKSVVLTANEGFYGEKQWIATPGIHTITAFVNDVCRIKESRRDNNKLNREMQVCGSSDSP